MDQKKSIREFARGWNDAQTGREPASRCDDALAYIAGYSCGAGTAEDAK